MLLPCLPGLTLLLAAVILWLIDPRDPWRAAQLGMAGGVVLLAGFGIGAVVSWRLAHPRPGEEEEAPPGRPPEA